MGARAAFVGRDSELEDVAGTLRASSEGRPAAFLVGGEPGVGKTRLLAEATTSPAAEGHLVLWGRCLRFGAHSSPFLPIGQILTQWHRTATPAERAHVLAGAEHLATIAPALGVSTEPADTTRILPLVATVLDRMATSSPVTLVVDDAHWADGTSLDLLAYIVAGFGAGQRLSVLVTYRDTDLGDGHRLHGWLADVARLPSVSQLRLERLGLAEAEELVSGLLGEGGATAFAADVFDKSGGNPYYTELLVRAAEHPPGAQQDDGLRRALLGSWHRLGPGARELLQLLAVGGRPVSVGVLERLVEARGRPVSEVSASLAEAGGEGLVAVRPDGEAWFHHPLVAEVVAGTLSPSDRVRAHREYVEVLQSAADVAPASRAAHLALHHHEAGEVEQAFTWSWRAADAALAVHAYAEEFDHLHRACRLWPDLSPEKQAAAEGALDLWSRASVSAWRAGEHLDSIRLREEAIALGDSIDPVRAVRLRLPLAHQRHVAGLETGFRLDVSQADADLAAARCPGSTEHVIAVAQLAFHERWTGSPDAATHAEQALAMAHRSGSTEALAWALFIQSQIDMAAPTSLRAAEQALALGVTDPELLGNIVVGTANCLLSVGRVAEAADVVLIAFRQLLALGSVQEALWTHPQFAAGMLVDLGRWDEARQLLRELLSHRLPAESSAKARGIAALLAFRSGDDLAGRTHLTRARELLPELGGPGTLLDPIEVEEQWACGRPREAIAAAARMMPAEVAVDPDVADDLLVLAARAAADLAERPGGRVEAVDLLMQVEQLREVELPWFETTAAHDLVHPAIRTLYTAERARCHGSPDQSERWRSAVSACAAAGLVWAEALASYRLARSLLNEPGSRQEAATSLRRAHRVATALGAGPILTDVAELGRQARIVLDEPVTHADVARDLPTALTAREREVLSHVLTGRTYAEIAAALFISQKTVSVHVSNLLRKTGTTSRIELADLARRTS